MSSAIAVECLVKRYRAGIEGCGASVEALRGIDLDVDEGELLGLVGPPSAGKTTLLLCAAGLMRPDAGRVVWFGRRRFCHAPPPGIAYVPDHPVHYTFLTVRESLEYYATLHDLPGARRRIDSALARSALRALARCRLSAVDGAARQRLGIARALLGEPNLLLLDAPLAGLGRQARVETREILRELHEGGMTIVLSAREVWEVDGLASRVVTLVGGRVRAELRWEGEGANDVPDGVAQPFAGGGLVAEYPS